MATQTTYSFRFSDTADGQLFNSRLWEQINKSESIPIGCLRVDGGEEDFFVVMKDVLSESEQDALNAVVALHEGSDTRPPINPEDKDNFIEHLGIGFQAAVSSTTEQNLPISSPQWLKSLSLVTTNGAVGDRFWVKNFKADGTTLIRNLVSGAYWRSNTAVQDFDFKNAVPIEADTVIQISYVAGGGNARTVNIIAQLWKSL